MLSLLVWYSGRVNEYIFHCNTRLHTPKVFQPYMHVFLFSLNLYFCSSINGAIHFNIYLIGILYNPSLIEATMLYFKYWFSLHCHGKIKCALLIFDLFSYVSIYLLHSLENGSCEIHNQSYLVKDILNVGCIANISIFLPTNSFRIFKQFLQRVFQFCTLV